MVELQKLNQQTSQTTQFMSDVSYIRNISGSRINPATDESIYLLSNLISGNEAVIMDDYTTTNMTYICKAPVGTISSAAGWKISRMDTTAGTVIKWADGNSNYDNIADNRASLTYT